MLRSGSHARLVALWQSVKGKETVLLSEKEKGMAGKGEGSRRKFPLQLSLLGGIVFLVLFLQGAHVMKTYSRKLMEEKSDTQGETTEPVRLMKQDSTKALSTSETKVISDNRIKNVRRTPRDVDAEVLKAPLDKMVEDASLAGAVAKTEAEKEMAELAGRGKAWAHQGDSVGDEREPCQASMVQSGDKIQAGGGVVHLPCGLGIGSAITLTGVASKVDTESKASGFGFVVEVQGLRIIDGEEAPRIFHLNPRLFGDWSGRAVVEHNTFYRKKWGEAQRCDGVQSKSEEEKVDGLPRCEAWSQADQTLHSSTKSSDWLQHLIHKTNKGTPEWPFPFHRDQMFVLTIRAGFEGFHVSVDGRHVTSFPYRSGYMVEEATAVYIRGHVVVDSFIGTSLPLNPPIKVAILEQKELLKAPPLKKGEIKMFIGILSASTHFEERQAVRKTWLQYPNVKSGEVAARFFLGMHPSKQVNVEIHKEAEFYGDVVLLPVIDQYDLVVVKTAAICEWGIEHTEAKYVMKADDDNFVRVQRVLENIANVKYGRGLYMGNINEGHRPLRSGKWAVTKEEWPEKAYPPYANGPGYILSRDLAHFIYNMKRQGSLRMFKMEDVSMGMWVMQYGINATVHYVHNWKFCQFGCLNDYITSHYQSPAQMLCLWEKLLRGDSTCCDDVKSRQRL